MVLGHACVSWRWRRVHQTMKALRRLSVAALLRLSARKTTETVKESSDLQSFNLPDQQPIAIDNETLTITTMPLQPDIQPDILEPTSYLQSLFNLTLLEYSRQTGIDLITHPLISSLDDIPSVDKAITVLRDRSQPLYKPQMDDNMVLLSGQLESIFNIVSLLTPSEALCDNIDPVRQSDLDLNSHTLYMRIF